MKMKVIMPVGEVPDGSVVTKRTGEVRYVVHDKYSMFAVDKNVEFKMDGCKILTPASSQTTFGINAIANDKEVVWITDSETLLNFLEMQESQ